MKNKILLIAFSSCKFIAASGRTLYVSKLFFFFLPLFFFLSSSHSQDVHFSQFSQAPQWVNPALTGIFNGDIRAIVNYRDQWRSISGAGAIYQTSAFAFDAGLFKKKWKNSYLGTGLFVFKDKAGEGGMGTTQLGFSLASIIYIAEGHQLSAGIQGGYVQRSLSPSADFRWENQFSGQKYDPSLPGENMDYSPFSYGDVSAGVLWNFSSGGSNTFKNNMFRANAGAAYYHINQPQQKFFGSEPLSSRLVVHAGSYVGLANSSVALLPSVFFMSQGPAAEFNIGLMVRYTLKEESKYTGIFKESALLLGGSLRAKDAFIPSLMFEFANFALGVSYDVNISALRAASAARGGMELSLRFTNPNPFSYSHATHKSVRFL